MWDETKLQSLTESEKYILQNSNLPRYQWTESGLLPDECDTESFIQLREIRESIGDFVINSDKNNLVICGKSLGNGKTSWAVKLLLSFIEFNKDRFKCIDERIVDSGKYDVCIFCQIMPFLLKMKQFGNNDETQKLYNRLEKSELVVLDDIGVTKLSQYDYNVLYAIVETRLFAGLPTIYTTNATSEKELADSIGGLRLAERIWKTSTIIELKGEGYRGI